MLTSLISLSYAVVIKHSIILHPINLYNKAYVTRKNKYLYCGVGETQPYIKLSIFSPHLAAPPHNHVISVISHILVDHFIISDVFGYKQQNANSTVIYGLTLTQSSMFQTQPYQDSRLVSHQVQWPTPVISATRRPRQEDHECKASLSNSARSHLKEIKFKTLGMQLSGK